jgi:hypothetical protein
MNVKPKMVKVIVVLILRRVNSRRKIFLELLTANLTAKELPRH